MAAGAAERRRRRRSRHHGVGMVLLCAMPSGTKFFAFLGLLAIATACAEDRAPAPEKDVFSSLPAAKSAESGDPLPGSGYDDFAAVLSFGGAKEYSPCSALLEKHRLDFDLPLEDREEFPDRSGGVLFDFPENLDEGESARLETACGGLLDHMRRAVRHEDVCGPKWPAVFDTNGAIENLGAVADFTSYSMIRADSAFEQGDFEEGCSRLLQALRFEQDVSRGYRGLVAQVAVLVGRQIAGAFLERALHQPGDISEDQLLDLDFQLEAIVANRPSPGVLLMSMVLYDVKHERASPDGMGTTDSTVDPAAEISPLFGNGNDFATIIILRSAWLRSRIYQGLCPCSATDAECLAGLKDFDAQADAWRERQSDPVETILDKVRLFTDHDHGRGQIDDLFIYGYPTIQGLVDENAELAFSLTALRVLALYRVEAQREGDCPDVEIFDSYELDEAMIDPTSGDRLRAEEIAPGKYVLRPSHDLFGYGDTTKPAVFIDCPFDGFGASAGRRP
jgi:hypothetical protein